MKQRPARHCRAGRKVFVNRKQSALSYSINLKKSALSIVLHAFSVSLTVRTVMSSGGS